MSERREEREWTTKARRDNEVFLGISFPLPNSDSFSDYHFLK
jgi:hypothetical protein